MKFSVTSGLLMQHLQSVAKVINPKSTNIVPVLANILFELKGNSLTLTASDLNNRLTSVLEVNNEGGDGSFIVSERIIIDSLKELPDQPITITVDDTSYKSVLQYNNGSYDFLSANADSFPASTNLSAEISTLELSAEGLLAGLNATKFAAGTDDRRPIMTGVHLDIYTDKIVYVASDGRILVRYTDTRVQSPEAMKLCLTASACKLLTTLLPKESGMVRLHFDAKHLRVEMGGFVLTARLLDGNYPAYNSVIPASSPFHATIGREALLYAAKRISLFANKASKLVLLDLTSEQIHLKANDIDFSTAAEETIPCQSDDIDRLRIGFDFELLKSLLESLESEQILLGLADQTRAGIITPVTMPEGVEILCLIIPIKLMGDY